MAASTFDRGDEDPAEPAEGYGEWVAGILEANGGPGTYVRFDEGPFSAERSFSDENPNDHSNHLGIWAYLTSGGKEPRPFDFGWGSHHVTVLKGRGRILDTSKYGKAELEKDLEKVAEVHGEEVALKWAGVAEERRHNFIKGFTEDKDLHEPERWEETMAELAIESTPFEVIDSAAVAFAMDTGADRRAGMTQFYVDLGYSVIEDPEGVIDTAGNTALGLTPQSMSVVKRYVFEAQ